ncbi:hypothetical protein [Luteolibacter luteus]|uniref:Capsid protein n=1 Tax=Luteolibacter luteus TaxID=2728835 RepID=A0A858RIB3_9BACT|nr:hypothetical protein [Luteolibacter luteus]QJE95960.1 hypothetical protein HHL09_09255 [Luteolibacter luteus]
MKTPLLNPVLTKTASRYIATLQTVGARIAPVVNVQDHAAQYYVYDSSNFTDIPTNIQRAPASGFKRLKSKLSSDSYIAQDYGIEEPMDKMQIRQFANVFAADKAAMQRAVRVVALNHEIRVRDMARATTATSSPSVKWGASSGTTIIADLEAAKAVIRGKIGVTPNLLTLPYNVYRKLILSPEIKTSFFGNTDGVLNKEKLESVLEVQIAVAGDLINTAQEGQTPSLGDIWSNEAFLSYSNPSEDMTDLNWARTFNWVHADGSGPVGISTFTYDQNEIDSRIVRARQYTDEKVVAAGAAYYFSAVLS